MTPVLTRPKPASVRRRLDVVTFVAMTVAAVLALFAAFALVRGPEFVGDVTIVNRTGEQVDVDVRRESDSELLALAVVPAKGLVRVSDVVDEGDTWIFEVSEAGRALGQIRLTKAELQRNGWRVVIPQVLASGN